jgi:hypothetical protein
MLKADAEHCSQGEVVRRLVREAPGVAAAAKGSIAVQVNEQEATRLLRMARRLGPTVTPAEVARTALVTHMTMAMSQSPFLMIFGRVLEDLVALGARPIVVDRWAVAAHGYITPVECLELGIRASDVANLRKYLAFRDCPASDRPLPFTVGHVPWSIRFVTGFGGLSADELPVESHGWGGTNVDVVTLDGLLRLPWSEEAEEEDYVRDAMQELKEGRHKLDDGERGVIAWDAVARMTCGLHPPDPGMGNLRFVDFRGVS